MNITGRGFELPIKRSQVAREPLSFARSLYLNIFAGMQIFLSAFVLNFPQFYIRAVYEYYRKRI
jgi:hypothetical protein